MCEIVISKKLNLEVIFLRAILDARRNTIGIGLIKPETIIIMVAYKLGACNLRAKIRISQLLEDFVFFK